MNAMVRHLFVVALLAGTAVPAASQDKATTVPVHFAKGASNSTVSGNVAGYDSIHYTLGAKAGQTMTVKVTGSSNANFNVFKPGDIPGQAAAIGSGYVGGDWSAKLPATGTYTVQVYQVRATARRGGKAPYTISFGIR